MLNIKRRQMKNMNDLVLIKIDNNEKVSCKELYAFLQLEKSQYSRWCKLNIVNNEFYEKNKDWQAIDVKANGNITTEYMLTIDFAKHLCMLARTARGKQARDYFIEVEKQYKQQIQQLCEEDLMIAQLQKMKQIRLEQEAQQKQLAEHAIKLAEIDARSTISSIEYYSIKGYAALNKLKIDEKTAKTLGFMASKASKNQGYSIEKIKDARYGYVNSYHEDILKNVFNLAKQTCII